MKRLVTTALAILCTAMALPAFAAETLETVVVTAGRVEEKAKNVTQAMTVIPREELEKHQYTDLGYVLRNYGVQVDIREAADSNSQIVMRGLRAPLFDGDIKSPILVLVDGRRIGTANISMLPTVGIERIEILRGPAAVQYGGSAIAGVVNVITKRGGKDFRASAEIGYGSWETWKSQAGISGSKGPLDFAGGVAWTAIDGDYKTGHGHRYKNTQLGNRTSYILNTGVTFLEEHRLGMALLGTESDRAGQPDALAFNALQPKTDRGNHSVDLTYDGGAKDSGLQWKARYFTARDRYRSYNSPFFANSKTTIDTQGAQGQLSWTKAVLTLTGGFDWTQSDYRNSVDFFRNTGDSGKSEYDNLGGFLLAKVGLFEDALILSGGVRYDDYSLQYEGEEKGFDNVSPSLGLAWHIADWLTFRSNYGESYRIPGAMDMTGYVTDNSAYGLPSVVYHGNPGLKPEKGIGWDAGFAIDYKALNLALTYFQTDYKDKIAERSYEGGSDLQWYNISGKVEYRGLEGQVGLDLGEVFDWPFLLRPYLNITHLFKYEDQEGRVAPNVRNTDLAYGVNFQYPSIGLEADLRFTYFGHQKEMDFTTFPSEEIKTGGETIADFFISKTLADWDDAGRVSLKGAVYNIFDAEYSLVSGYPMPGRSFYCGLRYDY